MSMCDSCRFYGGVFNGHALCNAPDASKLMDAPRQSCKHFGPKAVDR